MKPLLERKRRARINKCLDELKDIMTGCLQAQGENVSKLEKADILELTVRHLRNLNQARKLWPRNSLAVRLVINSRVYLINLLYLFKLIRKDKVFEKIILTIDH